MRRTRAGSAPPSWSATVGRGVWLCLAGLAATMAGAQSPPALGEHADFTALSLEELGSIKVPTVVGASKHEQKITEAPSSVSLVTRDEIRKFGHRTIADVLRSVRGFYVSYDRTYGYLGVRGFNRPGDFGGRMLVLIEGHRLNEPIFDSAFSDTGFPLDLDLIERVEVVRGPGSTLYGNNAFFGVINVVTRRGQAVNGVEAAASLGSFDSYQGRFSYGKAFTNGVEWLVSGSGYDSRGQDRLFVPEFNSPEQNNGVAENFDRDRAWSVFTAVRYGGLTLEGGYVSRRKDAPLVPYDTVFNDRRQHPIDSRGFASLGWNGTVAGDWQVSARGYYDFYGLDVDYPYNAADPGDPPSIVLNREQDSAHWTGLEGQISRVFLDRHRVTFGAEGRYDFSLNIHSYDVNPRALVADLRESSTRTGVFVQAEIAALTNLTFHLGGRYDDYRSFGDTLNPRAAIIYSPWHETTFKLLYGEAYRAPNLWEADFQNAFQKANPDLKPETIRTYELVYEQYLPADFRFSLSGFLNQTKDLIAQDTDPSDDLLFYRNLDEAETRGAEIEVEHRTPRGLLARASYSLQRTENAETGEEFSNSPRHLVKANLLAPLWQDQVFISAELQYSSSVRTRPGGVPARADSHWVVNLTLLTREILPNLDLSASLYNVFNQRYAYPAGDEYLPAVIPQDGRTFRVKLTYKF